MQFIGAGPGLVKALHNYAAMDDRDISFKNGDILAVTETHQDGWWKGELYDATRRQRGRDVFPCNYTVELGSPREEFASLPTTSDTDDCQSTLFYAKALYDYSASSNVDFGFKAGDIIAVTETPKHGPWRGGLLDETRRQPGRDIFPSDYVFELGKRGEALPSPHIRVYTDDGWPVLFYVRALYDYLATIDEEFDFRAGDVIAVTDAPKDGWWSGELLDETRRECGRDVFPSNYVRLI
ncbi:hypothetical protein V8E55_009269 [Tylopilus felleus]